MVSLARKNLLEDIPRFLVAQAGILFAVTLVTIQTGIFSGFSLSTVKLINNSHADLWVTSDTLVQLELTLPIPVSDLLKARDISGVQRAEGLIFSGAQWFPREGEIERARVIGFNPNSWLYQPERMLEGEIENLNQPYSVIIDTTDQETLQVSGVGDQVQMNSLPAEIVGITESNTSMISNAFVLTSLRNANAYLRAGQTSRVNCQLPQEGSRLECVNVFHPDQQPTETDPEEPPRNLAASDVITFILVEVAPGEEITTVRQELETQLNNVTTYTPDELIQVTQDYWQQRTGIGFILGLGTVVGIIVGIVVVSQILYSSVSDHLKEFGTLKAMGASSQMIYQVIIEQAVWMAILGYLPGMILSLGIAYGININQGTLLLITPTSAIAIFILTLIMCIGSAIFAIQKVNRVDPAVVFKA
ncbi:FtsX-like permease family protein [Euhalothece natronophila Z-M001]|uniref:FtsX-like permease family protein n=1 Tax=Euhalothece natronophila Z-M001 TaxID=522448 RepID=A0A5B8NNX3_9CHRO|nr:FtsX-like permease family protein [Euhalothece natronophila]QDZ40646.1 FtsX-like permease family protein [Euhalothece natronophila Z-M001]